MSGIKIDKKIIYAIAGVIALIVLYLIFSSGSESTIAPQVNQSLIVGQTYTLDNPNQGKGDVLLVRTPGKFGSREDESKESENVCVVKGNTAVKFEQETMLNYMAFVKVQPTEGDCVGKSGWTAKINVK